MNAIVGQSVVRVDAEAKVNGSIKYIDDINMEGQLYGVTVRSPHPCANVRKIVFDGSYDWSEIITFTAEEIPGENIFNNFNMDVPFLPKNNRVNHVGEPVCLVAAPSLRKAKEAASHVFVDYEVLTPALSIEEGLAKKSLIYADDNIIKKYTVNKGDPQSAFAKAKYVFEGTYRTPYQEQAYIETQGMIAVPDADGDGVTIYGSLQCPYYVRKESQKLFTFEPEKLRVVQVTTGGGFGGKEHFPSIIAAHSALLALKAKKPVKMIYERHEDMAATTKRHPSLINIKTGVDENGKLIAVDVDILFDGGAYSMASPVVLARAAIAGAGAYNCDNISILARAVATNLIPTSAYRGFGAPQIFYAVERHMTRFAENIGVDPLTFRKVNLLKQFDVTATGQTLKDPVGLKKCIDLAVEKTDFEKLYQQYKKQPSDLVKRKGIGIMAVFHGAGFTGKGEDRIRAKAGVKLLPSGEVKILCSTTEMGQGMRTILPQIVAETLQLPFAKVSVETTDTSLVPDSGPTVASRTTMIVGKVLRDASLLAIEALTELIAAKESSAVADIAYESGAFAVKGSKWGTFADAAKLLNDKGLEDSFYSQYASPPGVVWNEDTFQGDAYAGYGWAATVAEVEVDTGTFEISVTRLVSAEDMGKAINPILVEGQIEGGCIQAFGYSILEDIIMKDGHILNDRFTNYIIPTSADVPFVETVIVEEGYANGPYGAKGVGEMPLVVVASAIADAVSMATGIDVLDIPITPEKLFELSLKK